MKIRTYFSCGVEVKREGVLENIMKTVSMNHLNPIA